MIVAAKLVTGICQQIVSVVKKGHFWIKELTPASLPVPRITPMRTPLIMCVKAVQTDAKSAEWGQYAQVVKQDFLWAKTVFLVSLAFQILDISWKAKYVKHALRSARHAQEGPQAAPHALQTSTYMKIRPAKVIVQKKNTK